MPNAGGGRLSPVRTGTLRWFALLAIALASTPPAGAQTVTSVSGSTLTLSVGARAGVKAGMTGRVFRMDEVKVFEAEFEVTKVEAARSSARVTRQVGPVVAGLQVEFDQKLQPPAATPEPNPAAPTPPPLPSDPLKLLEIGTTSLERGEPERALAAFEKLLQLVPGDAMATKGRERARQKIAEREAERQRQAAAREAERQRAAAEARRAEEAARGRKEAEERLRYLRGALAAAEQLGDRPTAEGYAREIASLDPAEPKVEPYRAASRERTIAAARVAAEAGDDAAYRRAWSEQATAWGEEAVATAERAALDPLLATRVEAKRTAEAERAAREVDERQPGRVKTEAQRLPAVTAATKSAPPGTWIDESTGLMWAARDNGHEINATKARAYCANLELAGFRDWRLPLNEEVLTLYDRALKKTKPVHYRGKASLSGKDLWTGQWNSNDACEYLSFRYGKIFSNPCTFANDPRALCVRK